MNTDQEAIVPNTGGIDDLIPPFGPSRGYGAIDSNYQETRTSRLRNAFGAKMPQFIACITAALSAMSAGAVISWTAPLTSVLENGEFHHIPLDASQVGWIGSLVPLGALTACIPTGFICDKIGRKVTLLTLIIPHAIGWSLIMWSTNVQMLYCGRFVTGMAVGATCVAAPLYISEVVSRDLRGHLGTYFQLFVVAGVFYADLFGKYLTPTRYTLTALCLPVLFFVSFIYQPESPIYCLKRQRYDAARDCLSRLRKSSTETEVDRELLEMESAVKTAEQNRVSFRAVFTRRATRKAVLISMSLMFFQQFSGINAIIFYTSSIFKMSGLDFDPKSATILVGFFQLVATFISSLIIERLGRRFLLMTSSTVMALSNISLAIFFGLKDHGILDNDTILKLGFIPVGSLCIYVVVFSLGFGPIPWLISGEIFSSEVKSIASSLAGTFNWSLAFIITRFYLEVQKDIGADTVYYFFGFCCLVGTGFTYFVIPETRGRTIEEIQEQLEN